MTMVTEPQRPIEASEASYARPPGAVASVRIAGMAKSRWLGIIAIAVAAGIAAVATGTGPGFPAHWVTGIQASFDAMANWITVHQTTAPFMAHFLTPLGNWLGDGVNWISDVLNFLTWPGVIALFAGCAVIVGNWRLALFVVVAMAYFGVIGLWAASMSTLALMSVSVMIAVLIGIPLGIASASNRYVEHAIRPVLDLMQMLPAYAYLVPIVLLFSIGNPGGIVATVIYATPPVIRLTMLGIHAVPSETIEAGKSFGSSRMQLLTKVQLPLALRPIIVGINQVIMMALSVVVVASLIGTGGLGDPVLQALNIVDVGDAFTAGVAIVLMAMILDRIVSAGADRVGRRSGARSPNTQRNKRILYGGVAAGIVAAVIIGTVVSGPGGFPPGWSVSISAPVNSFLTWLQAHLYHYSSLPIIGGTSNLSAFTTLEILNPLTRLAGNIPWWLAVFVTAALGYFMGGWRRALLVALGVMAIGYLGMWSDSAITLAQVIVALVMCVLVGIPLGIAAYWWNGVDKALRPVLDVLQTMPAFVYLIPVVLFFGVGNMAGVAASFVYALAPAVRLTNLGLREIKRDMVEAGNAFGSTRLQLLWKVELPAARPAIILAVNQTIMLVLAEVIVAGLVGGGGLGYDVVVGLERDQFGLGLAAGLAIVVMGVVFDRLTQGRFVRRLQV